MPDVLNLQAFPRLGLDDFDFGVAGANLFLEPVSGIRFAVAQEHGAGRDLSDEAEQFIAIGVGGEVEIQYFTATGDLAGAGTKDESLARFRRFQPAAWGVGVGVTDEENGLSFVADHAGSETVGGGVLAHHAGGEDEDAPDREPNLFDV